MKKCIQENYRVEVIPEGRVGNNYIATHEDCEELRKEIERHCDIDEAYTEHDTKCVCEFCGCEWEDEWDNDIPFCCNEAQDEYKRLKEEALNNTKDELL